MKKLTNQEVMETLAQEIIFQMNGGDSMTVQSGLHGAVADSIVALFERSPLTLDDFRAVVSILHGYSQDEYFTFK